MKTTLHTTTCYPKPSLRVAKRIEKSTTNMRITHSLIRKLPHWLIFLFISLSGYAQNWDWAISGGGTYGALGFDGSTEQIFDIKVGSDNNYYFIATIKNGSPQLNGQSVTVYSPNSSTAGGSNDIFLFSTTSTGTVRWIQAIGGGSDNRAYNLVLDSNNNVYIGAFLKCYINDPVHFSATETVTATYSTNYLVKYDSNGVFQAKKALQGTVANANLGIGQLLDLAIDSQNRLHFIVGLQKGTHLDGNITVPNTITAYQYFLAQYDSDLDYISSILLPIADGTGFATDLGSGQRFVYDENLNRYYLAGMRSDDVSGPIIPLTYDGNAFEERSYILAIDGTDGSEVWRREIRTNELMPGQNYAVENNITSLIIDTNSDVYVSGRFLTYPAASDKSLSIYDPSHSNIAAYTFTPKVTQKIPTLIKFNSNTGAVQWVKTPDGHTANFSTSSNSNYVKGLAIRGNEIAMGAFRGYFIWDNFQQNYPIYTLTDGSIVRFNKQTAQTVGLHDIDGAPSGISKTTALAVDNDGSYVVGGNFNSTLFSNTGNITPLVSTGYEDFFVAKLDSPLSTEDFNTITVNVYPNPTTNIVNVETTEPLAGYTIYDALGRVVRGNTFENNSNQINLETASNGVYFIKVTTQNGNVGTVKVVKE